MLGTEKSYELGHFVMGERVAEAGHFLATVFDLGGDLRWLHSLANVGEGRTFLGALGCDSVAIGAAFVAEESGSGLFRSMRSGGVRLRNGQREGRGDGQDGQDIGRADFAWSHIYIFSSIPQFASTCGRVQTW